MDLAARIDLLNERGYDDELVAALVGITREEVVAQRRDRTAPTEPTSGPISFGPSRSYTFTEEDLADPDSYWGHNPVKYFDWTPTSSGNMILVPPASDDGDPDGNFDWYLFRNLYGDSNTEWPNAGPDSGSWNGVYSGYADAYTGQEQVAAYPVTAGLPHKIAITSWGGVDAVGTDFPLDGVLASLAGFGGHEDVSPGAPPAPPAGVDRGGVVASMEGSFVLRFEKALAGQAADAIALGTARALAGSSVAENNATVLPTGNAAHAEGSSQAAGAYSHAEGGGFAEGAYSHAEGAGTYAEGLSSHAIGGYAHAEPDYSAAHQAWQGGGDGHKGDSQWVREPMTAGDQVGAGCNYAPLWPKSKSFLATVTVLARNPNGATKAWRAEFIAKTDENRVVTLVSASKAFTALGGDAGASGLAVTIDADFHIVGSGGVVGYGLSGTHWLCMIERWEQA